MERIRDLLPDAFESQDAVYAASALRAEAPTQPAPNALVEDDSFGETPNLHAAQNTELREGSATSGVFPFDSNGEAPMNGHADSEGSQEIPAAELPQTWGGICSEIERHLNPQIFAAWIKPLTLAGCIVRGSGSELRIEVPNKFSAQHLQRNYLELLRAAACRYLSSPAEIKLIIRELPAPGIQSLSSVANQPSRSMNSAALAAGAQNSQNRIDASKKVQGRSLPVSALAGANQVASDNTNLNPNYNFSNFVVGGCNQFAHAVSLQVSENLGSTYNPLFIYGGVGLGKTHLANAIGNASRRRNKKVLLVSSETFVSELISSLRSNTMERFKNKFRSLDLLIIDDIQFIIGKERTQEEFFHTFNELYNHNKQIIVTCDKVPQELIGLEDRLRTRFACGVSADLQAPDFETRVAILIKKAQTRNIELSDEVARIVAERIDTNVRELEGALNRLIAMSTLQKCSPTVELAREIVQTLSPSQRVEITTDKIQKVVAARFNVSIGDLLGKRRTHNIAFARQVAMYLCREHTGCSYPELGALFGGRDHSTVIHARKVITEKIKTDTSFEKDILQLQLALQTQ